MMKFKNIYTKYLYNKHFQERRVAIFKQSLLTMLVLVPIFFFLSLFTNLLVISSLGATTYIAFSMPHSRRSHPRNLIGGNLIGVLTGFLTLVIGRLPVIGDFIFFTGYEAQIFGAMAVGFTVMFMAITAIDHPPGASLALGIAFNNFEFLPILLTLFAVLLVVFLRERLKKYLANLGSRGLDQPEHY